MQKFSAADYVAMPWKNGGGVTTQFAIAPIGASLANFEWRISSAQVETAGPFSLFAGIDRSLAILCGAGLTMAFDGMQATILTPDNKPLAFRGEQYVHAALLDGPITDLNVMTRRTHCTHTLEKIRLDSTQRCARQADLMFVYCAQGSGIQCSSANGGIADCTAGDAILIDAADGGHVDLSASAPAVLYIARLVKKGNPDAE
jgi:hypothetical protein